MLRITEISNLNNNAVLKLEGKIVGQWVAVLEKQFEEYFGQKDSLLVLDFEEVSYISSEAITILNRYKEKIIIIKAQPYLELCLKNRGLKNLVN